MGASGGVWGAGGWRSLGVRFAAVLCVYRSWGDRVLKRVDRRQLWLCMRDRYSLCKDHIWLLQRGCAEVVGGVLLASDSRRSCGYSLGREHISARGMMLLASDLRRSCGYSLSKDHIWHFQRGGVRR